MLYCCETWVLTVTDEMRLNVVEYHPIRMCGVRLVNRVSTDVLQDRMSVVVKIEKMIMQSHLQWYDHVICGDINSQICEVMELEITRKRKKGWPRKLWEQCLKKDLDPYELRREDVHDWEKWEEQLKAEIANPVSWDNDIKTEIVVPLVTNVNK